MVFHCHYSNNPNSGDTRRIRNIDKDLAARLSDEIVEIEFFRLKALPFILRHGIFHMSEKVVRKFYIPLFPKSEKINELWKSFVIYLLNAIYKPSHVICEIYAHELMSKMLKNSSNKPKLILDIHGASQEEYLYNNSNVDPVVSQFLYNREKESVDNADYIICQSETMKQHLAKKFSVDISKVCVYRCGVDTDLFSIMPEDREKIRKQLNVSNESVVFVYSGGLFKWQKIEESLSIFNKYHKNNPNSIFLILTPDITKLDAILKTNNLESLSSSIKCMSLLPTEVPMYLNAADVAFLLRDNDIMNAVASPTKLAEYLACGLPIITSMVSMNWVREDGLCYLMFEEKMGDIDSFIKLNNKKQISRFARETLSLVADKRMLEDFIMNIK